MPFTVHDSPAAFDLLRPQWNALVRAGRFDNLFMTWEWQTTWWRHLGTGDLYILEVRDGGDLVGIVPLYLETSPHERRFNLVGCIEVSDYLDVIAPAGAEEAVLKAFVDFLTSADAPPWDVVDLCNLPEASLTHQVLPALAARQGLEVHRMREDVSPVIPLPETWEAYLAMLSKKDRHELRRKLRRLQREASFRWWRAASPEDLPTAVEAFLALHRASSPAKHAFMDDQMAGFFRAVAEVLLQRGWLWLSLLEVEGEPAAGLLCFDYADRIWVYNSGYDPRYVRVSPGVAAVAFAIRDAIEAGRAVFDFLQGAEEYKYQFGARDTEIIRVLLRKGPSGAGDQGEKA
jgi:CelD/BcsL family acetyltransferase involved in cellulose biosynthesis